MLINKRQYTLATLRIMKTQEMMELEAKGILEDVFLRRYKRLRFWIPLLSDLLIIWMPFSYGLELNVSNIIVLAILAIVTNFITARFLDTYYENKFNKNKIKVYDDLKPRLINELKDILLKATQEEMKKEEIDDYKIIHFGIHSTQMFYEIPIQYSEKIL